MKMKAVVVLLLVGVAMVSLIRADEGSDTDLTPDSVDDVDVDDDDLTERALMEMRRDLELDDSLDVDDDGLAGRDMMGMRRNLELDSTLDMPARGSLQIVEDDDDDDDEETRMMKRFLRSRRRSGGRQRRRGGWGSRSRRRRRRNGRSRRRYGSSRRRYGGGGFSDKLGTALDIGNTLTNAAATAHDIGSSIKDSMSNNAQADDYGNPDYEGQGDPAAY